MKETAGNLEAFNRRYEPFYRGRRTVYMFIYKRKAVFPAKHINTLMVGTPIPRNRGESRRPFKLYFRLVAVRVLLAYYKGVA